MPQNHPLDFPKSQFLEYRIFSGTSCGDAGESRRNRYPLLRAAYQEAKRIATSKEQQRLVASMRESAKREWLALPRNSAAPENPVFPAEIEKDLQ